MKLPFAAVAALALALAATGCNQKSTPTTSTNAEGGSQTATNAKLDDSVIKDALDKANLGNVKVDVDNDNRVVKLNGSVQSDDQRAQAEQIARNNVSGYVVANQLAVEPSGDTTASKVNSKLDDAIESQWKALEARNKTMWGNHRISAAAKNGVLTLKGDVDTMKQHDDAEKAASNIPNVRQVVNELQVKQASQ